jgi:RNA polymerase sigma factor (sigma-70 family)
METKPPIIPDPIELRPRVVGFARKQKSNYCNLSLADLVGEGIVGLMVAYRRYEQGLVSGDFTDYALTSAWYAISSAKRDFQWIRIDRRSLAEFRKGRSTARAGFARRAFAECRRRVGDYGDFVEAFVDRIPSDDPDVWDMLSCLTPDESEVVQLRLGLDGPDLRSFEDVAALMGIEKHRVYHSYRKAMKKLREHLHENQSREG